MMVGYDPWHAAQMSQQLLEQGIQVAPFHQRPGTWDEPLTHMLRAIRQGRIFHDHDDVAGWQAGNLILRIDRDGKKVPDKQESHKKIDGIVSLGIAYGTYMFLENPGGLLVLE